MNDIATTTSNRWQNIGAIPALHFERIIATLFASDEYAELTTNLMLRMAQDLNRTERAEQMADAPPLPSAKYRVVYADPPWEYNDSGVIVTASGAEVYPRAKKHYPTMTIDELCGLGDEIRSMVESDAVLFIWVTSPLLEECFPVIRSWGFQYKTSFVWDKVKHNYGHYNSVRHEFLLVCTRGSCTPDVRTLHDSVVEIERTEHSVKPDEFRAMIDSLYTWGKRIELFARRPADGWDAWGNQA